MRCRTPCCSSPAPTPQRPAEEWKPLFYRILENRIRDMQRRRTVRGRVIAWLPFRGEDDDDEPDPIAQAPSPEPQPVKRLELNEAMGALEKALEELPRRQQQAFLLRTLEGHGRGRDGRRHGLLGRQRQDTLLSRRAGTARATRRFLRMSPEQEPLTHFERNARTVLEESVQRIDARTRSRLNQARQAALAAAAAEPRLVAQLHAHAGRRRRGRGAAGRRGAVAPRAERRSCRRTDAQRSAVEDMDLLADSEGWTWCRTGTVRSTNGRPAQADASAESDG